MCQTIPAIFPTERPVQLWLDGKLLTTLYCTPRELEELALGYLLSHGLLEVRSLPRLTVRGEPWRVDADTRGVPGSPAPWQTLSTRWQTTLEAVTRQAAATMANTPLRQSSGGVHGASVGWSGGLLVREDIARHNAVDKAVGAGIINGTDFSGSILFTTGRLSYEMLSKAAAVGIPVVASMKYPSDLGVALAAQNKICVVGRVLSSQPVVYTGGWRLGLEPIE